MRSVCRIPVAGGERAYLVHAPPAPGPLPVVVMLHGAGGTALWTLRETRWVEAADREGFLLVLPEATRPDPSRPAGFLENPQVWNDGAADAQPPRPAVDDVGFIVALLGDLAGRYAIDAELVYLTGFSNGAAMAFRVAAERSDRFAAVAPVAGYCHVRVPQLVKPIPTLYMIGAADPLVPLDGGEVVSPWGRRRSWRPPVRDTLEGWARALGCSTQRRTLEQSSGLSVEEYPGPVPFLVYTIADLGHHWPGGRGELNRRIAGPPSDRVDGCAAIWEFCRGHQRLDEPRTK